MNLSRAFSTGFRARWLLPVATPPIHDAYLECQRGRIRRMEPFSGQRPAIDLGDVILLPQLVNAHTHLEFSALRQPIPATPGRFADWLRQVIAYRQSVASGGPADPGSAIERGGKECLGHHTILVGEICTNASLPYDRAGPIDGVCFLELMGIGETRQVQQLARARQFLTAPPAAGSWARGLSPHAPYTAPPGLVRGCVRLAREWGVPLAMHLAESREELQFLEHRGGPLRELLEARERWDESAWSGVTGIRDYLEMLTEAPRSLVIHGNYLSAEDRQLLSLHRSRITVVYCPRTHHHFGHERYPLPALLQEGVAVAIGTDSRASNPDLQPWQEMRFIADNYPELSPRKILEMGTINGAIALGDHRRRGRLEVGGAAHVCQVQLGAAAAHRDPYEAIWTCGQPPEPVGSAPGA